MGLETEYGILAMLGAHRHLPVEDAARRMFAPIVEQYRSSNIYTDNASRLYLDVGSHPEIATAECDSLHQLIAYDRAGDLTVHRLAAAAESELTLLARQGPGEGRRACCLWREVEGAGTTGAVGPGCAASASTQPGETCCQAGQQGSEAPGGGSGPAAAGTAPGDQTDISARVYLLKNNTDSVGNSYGCHENYLVSRDIPLRSLSCRLLPFLVTRQLIAGAGKIANPAPGAPNENFGPGFTMSQRADHVWEGISSATTRSRPIINTRDEPHADSSRYRRLHIIVGDSNMSEITTALKVGTTLLVLEMIEAGVDLPAFDMANETRAIREIARDFTGTTPIRLHHGRETTPLEIQRSLHAAATRWLEVRPEPEEGVDTPRLGEARIPASAGSPGTQPAGTPTWQLRPIVELWGRVLDCFDTGDFAPVSSEIDWVIKKNLLDRMATRGNLSITDPKLAHVDLTYHDIDPQRGLFSLLTRRGVARRLLTDEEIAAAVEHPPATTRAALRGRFLAAARHSSRSVTVDWMRLKVNGERGWEVVLSDPFAASNPDVDALIAELGS